VDGIRQAIGEPDLFERDPDPEADGPGGDQRPPVRRRPKELS